MKLSEIGEFKLIKRFLSGLPKFPSGVLLGPGDDCAVVRWGSSLQLLTTDMLIEGVHFRRDWMTPKEIGEKAMLVNLSDIAAMGGTPRYALVSVGLPRSFSIAEAERLFVGMARTGEKYGVEIVGGDTNASERLIVAITLLGEPAGDRVLTRSGARVGDAVYVSGTLGESALGLEALRKGKGRGYERFIGRHRRPPCRIDVGKRLARAAAVHSLIDLSDGLAGDLRHILEESGVGAEVDIEKVPVSPGFFEKARRLGRDADLLKLAGGEDYELLWTASPGAGMPRKINGVPVAKIGTILPKGAGLRLIDSRGKRFRKKISGFRHF